MKQYYISRGFLSLVFGGIVYLICASAWIAVVSAVIVFAAFVLISRSGRYRVKPEKGVAAMQRDEWTQGISQKAGRNAWVIVALMGSLTVLYYSVISPGDVPVFALAILLLLGLLTYYVSDLWFRRL
jgi:hypothetical protein